MKFDEHTVDLASANAFYRSAPAQITPTPVFIHGVPTSADVWDPVLDATGGIALDLPGFGRSDKGGHLDYSVDGLAHAVGVLIDRLELESVSLVGHGWGAVVASEVAAQRGPATGRLVLINPIALDLPWPRAARICNTRGAGELAMGALTRRVFARLLRRGGRWRDDQLNALWEQFDQGTQRAILRLHRADAPTGPPPRAQTLVLYGDQDPWLGHEHAQRAAATLPNATLQTLPGAGHWPWLDRAETVQTIADFLAA